MIARILLGVAVGLFVAGLVFAAWPLVLLGIVVGFGSAVAAVTDESTRYDEREG